MNCTLRTQVDAFTSWSRGGSVSLSLKTFLPRCIFPRCDIPVYKFPLGIIPGCISLRTPSLLQLCQSATPGNKIFCICDWTCRMSLCFSCAKMRKQAAAHLRCPLCCVGQEICWKLFTWVWWDFLFNPKTCKFSQSKKWNRQTVTRLGQRLWTVHLRGRPSPKSCRGKGRWCNIRVKGNRSEWLTRQVPRLNSRTKWVGDPD